MKQESLAKIRSLLLQWGRDNFRYYPWRETKDPYKILIAEILLHRTRADQVVPLYQKFIIRFPTIRSILEADIDEIKELLASAGLFWRIDLIYRMAQVIESDFNGRIPENKQDLLSLPGVGNYIASAIRCFAWNHPEILVDTNTVRITGRIFGTEVNDGSRRQRQFLQKMEELLDRENPVHFNFALLDLGSKICLSREPLCEKCPVSSLCKSAFQKKV